MTDDTKYIYVDVDCGNSRRVTVYDAHGEIRAREFVSRVQFAEWPSSTITADPYSAACAYARKVAADLGCDWGSNE